MKYSLDAVHSIFKRVIKNNLSFNEFTDLTKELLDLGYESDNMVVEQFYEEGDHIKITEDMVKNLPDTYRFDKNFLLESFAFPIEGYLFANRFDRFRVFLGVKWDVTKVKRESWLETNTQFLEEIGFKFIQPEHTELSVLECDEYLLDAEEIVIKYLMLRNDWSFEEATEYLKPLTQAMNKAHAVFYQP